MQPDSYIGNGNHEKTVDDSETLSANGFNNRNTIR